VPLFSLPYTDVVRYRTVEENGVTVAWIAADDHPTGLFKAGEPVQWQLGSRWAELYLAPPPDDYEAVV
jgi:hypothetical protein